MVRSPDKLGELAADISVVTGSVIDPQVISAAAEGCGAVLSTIGSPAGFLGRGATTIYSQTATALVTGMDQAGISQLLFCTSAGVEDHDPGEILPYRLIVKPLFLQRAYDDIGVAETVITCSDRRWTLVRPEPADQPARRPWLPSHPPFPCSRRNSHPPSRRRSIHARPSWQKHLELRHTHLDDLKNIGEPSACTAR